MELVRDGDVLGAIERASSVGHLGNGGDDERRGGSERLAVDTFENVMALLAFPDPNDAPSADVLGASQRFALASAINAELVAGDRTRVVGCFL